MLAVSPNLHGIAISRERNLATHGRRRLLLASVVRQADSGHYTRAFVLRRPLALAQIGSGFPAITRMIIQQALGSEVHRIEALEYDVNVEGLESEDGTSGFSLVIPQ